MKHCVKMFTETKHISTDNTHAMFICLFIHHPPPPPNPIPSLTCEWGMESDREGSKRGGLCTVTTPTGQQKQSHKILTKGVTKQNHINIIKILQMPPMTSRTFFFSFFEHRYLWYMNSVILWKKITTTTTVAQNYETKVTITKRKKKMRWKQTLHSKGFQKKEKKKRKCFTYYQFISQKKTTEQNTTKQRSWHGNVT